MLRRIWTTRTSEDRSAFSDALLPVGASLLVPLFAAVALKLPPGAIERIAAPLLGGGVTAAAGLPVTPAEPQGSHSMRGRTPVGGTGSESGSDAVVRGVVTDVPGIQIVAVVASAGEPEVVEPSETPSSPGDPVLEVVDPPAGPSSPVPSNEPVVTASAPEPFGSPTDSNPGPAAPSAEDDEA